MPRLLKHMTLLSILLGFALLAFGLFAAWLYLAQPTLRHNQFSSVSADPLLLEGHVKNLSVNFHPRNFRNLRNLDASAEYILKAFSAAGAKASMQVYAVNGRNYQNVIARFGITDPKAGRWIIGAHYDSCADTPGADDNASGVAGLLELARLLGGDPNPPPVELVAYTLEEPPYFRSSDMGSAHHARTVIESGIPVKGVIILEMIGYFTGQPGTQEYPIGLLRLFYPGRGDFLIVVGQLGQRAFTREVKIGMKNPSGLPVYSINGPVSLPGIDFSDHLNYWAYNLPAVMITDTAFYRNKAYHEKEDTWDRLDYDKMAKGVTAVYQSLLRLDKLEK